MAEDWRLNDYINFHHLHYLPWGLWENKLGTSYTYGGIRYFETALHVDELEGALRLTFWDRQGPWDVGITAEKWFWNKKLMLRGTYALESKRWGMEARGRVTESLYLSLGYWDSRLRAGAHGHYGNLMYWNTNLYQEGNDEWSASGQLTIRFITGSKYKGRRREKEKEIEWIEE